MKLKKFKKRNKKKHSEESNNSIEMVSKDAWRQLLTDQFKELDFERNELITQQNKLTKLDCTTGISYKSIMENLQSVIEKMDTIQQVLNNTLLPPQDEEPAFDFSLFLKDAPFLSN